MGGAYGSYPAPVPAWQHPQPMYEPRRRDGLAIAAVIMAALALLGVLGLGIATFVGSELAPSWVLTGDVQPVNGSTTASALQHELTRLLEDDGSFVDDVTCPDSSPVDQGAVTVCHGQVDGWDWTGIVYFEDGGGAFTLVQH
jgi:hypothetical protein